MSLGNIAAQILAGVASNLSVIIPLALAVIAGLEILALYLANIGFARSNLLVEYTTGKSTKEIKSFRIVIVRDYANRALTLAGLSLAGLAIILTDPTKFSAVSMAL